MRAEDNRKLTETGPGTPGGRWMRLYWQPVALSEELAGERAVVPVRVLGEDLVLFRDDRGVTGLIDRRCAHRGADLSLGRLEDGGLRCYFHGWLYGWEQYWARSIQDLREASPWASGLRAALATGPAGIPGSQAEPDGSQSPDPYDRSES
jgi:hypothetical protein